MDMDLNDVISQFNSRVREAYASVINDLSGEDTSFTMSNVSKEAALLAILDLANAGQTDVARLAFYGRSRARAAMSPELATRAR